MPSPVSSKDPLYLLLSDERVDEFNRQRPDGKRHAFKGLLFRARDLRGVDARGIDFGDAYFRDADLRGIDFRESNLEGASLSGAKISGAYFPAELTAEEIRMSVEFGTRLRYRR